MNIHTQVFLCGLISISLWYIPRNIVGHVVALCLTVKSGNTILHSHKQCLRATVSPHPSNTFISLSIIPILMDVKYCLTVYFTCISLTTNIFLVTCIFFVEMWIQSLAHFLMRLFVYLLLSLRIRYKFWRLGFSF